MTTRQRWEAIGVVLLLATLLGLLGVRYYRSSPAQNSGYSSDLNELRAWFNRDQGKVRILMLLSPT